MTARNVLLPLASLAIILAFWEGTVHAFDPPGYLVAPPSAIAVYVHEHIGDIFRHFVVTMEEACLGFVLGSSVAFLCALVLHESRIAREALYPYVVGLKAVPIVAVAPLLVIWFGAGLLGKVVMAALICFFPVVVNVLEGLQSTTTAHIELFHSLNASRWQTLTKLRIPIALPYLFSALRISATFSVVGAIVAEFSGATEGLGYMIMVALYKLDIPALYAGILASAVAGCLFFGSVHLLQIRLVPWSRTADRINSV